jgi:hypothetical protein
VLIDEFRKARRTMEESELSIPASDGRAARWVAESEQSSRARMLEDDGERFADRIAARIDTH